MRQIHREKCPQDADYQWIPESAEIKTRRMAPISNASRLIPNIERHPLTSLTRLARETMEWSGTPRYDVPDAPLVNCPLGFAQAGDARGPFLFCCNPFLVRG